MRGSASMTPAHVALLRLSEVLVPLARFDLWQ